MVLIDIELHLPLKPMVQVAGLSHGISSEVIAGVLFQRIRCKWFKSRPLVLSHSRVMPFPMCTFFSHISGSLSLSLFLSLLSLYTDAHCCHLVPPLIFAGKPPRIYLWLSHHCYFNLFNLHFLLSLFSGKPRGGGLGPGRMLFGAQRPES